MIPEPTGTTAVATNPGYAKLFAELGVGSLAVGIAGRVDFVPAQADHRQVRDAHRRSGHRRSRRLKTPRYRGKAKVDLQSLVLRTPPRLDSEWHLRVGRNESKASEPSIFANLKEEVDFSRGKSSWVCANSWL